MTDDAPTDAARLLALINASWISQAIYVAAELGLADRLASGEQLAEQLAEQLGADAGALHRLLRALVTIDVCRESEGGAFCITRMGRLLTSDHGRSLRAWARWWGGHLWPVWGDLLDSVQTGISARQRASGGDGAEALERDSAAAELFHQAMGQLTRVEAEEVVRAYSFEGVTTVVDVGGGRGELLGCILEANPACRGVLLDRPHALARAEQHLRSVGVRDRCDLVAGDFFEDVPRGGDLYILKSVVHDWNDERASCLLQRCRRAMSPAARLLIVERLLPERLTNSTRDRAIVQSDLHMLIGPGGLERSESELLRLTERAGLRVDRVLPAGVVSLLEARPLPTAPSRGIPLRPLDPAIASEFETKAPKLYAHSALYRGLARRVATEPRLLDIAADAQPGQSPMAMFFAAVHFVVLRGAAHPLSTIYADIARRKPIERDPTPHFVDFCLAHEHELRRVISTSRIQTNEPGRAVYVRLGLEWIGLRFGSDAVAYVELGASAGLNLNWDRFLMRFEGEDRGWKRGPESSPVRIDCSVSGLEFPAERGATLPPMTERLGLDIDPLDIERSTTREWLRSFIWADDCDRLSGFDSAITLLRNTPVPLMKADVTRDLVEVCRGLRSTRLVIAHTFLTSQLTAAHREAMNQQLQALCKDREVFRIGAEWSNGATELRVGRLRHGHPEDEVLLATGEPHGRSIRWVHPGSR